jgi:hypothetical protein
MLKMKVDITRSSRLRKKHLFMVKTVLIAFTFMAFCQKSFSYSGPSSQEQLQQEMVYLQQQILEQMKEQTEILRENQKIEYERMQEGNERSARKVLRFSE